MKDIILKNKVTFIVWSNGIGKSTFARQFAKDNGWDYYNPIEIQHEQDRNPFNKYWKTTGISLKDTMLQHFSSDWENYFDKLFKWTESHGNKIILDEADKWLSMQWQWNYMHFIADQVNNGKQLVVITHSYICIKIAIDMWIYIYDMDTKTQFQKSSLPPI